MEIGIMWEFSVLVPKNRNEMASLLLLKLVVPGNLDLIRLFRK